MIRNVYNVIKLFALSLNIMMILLNYALRVYLINAKIAYKSMKNVNVQNVLNASKIINRQHLIAKFAINILFFEDTQVATL